MSYPLAAKGVWRDGFRRPNRAWSLSRPPRPVVRQRFRELTHRREHLVQACIVGLSRVVPLGATCSCDDAFGSADVPDPFVGYDCHVVDTLHPAPTLSHRGPVRAGGSLPQRQQPGRARSRNWASSRSRFAIARSQSAGLLTS